MNPLELYLNRVARELRSMPSVKRDEELRELRSHLELRVEDFQSGGCSTKEAQTRAVEAFGSPRALGSKLCDAWEGIEFSWWRLAARLIGVLVLWLSSQLALYFGLFPIIFSPANSLFPEWPYYFAAASLFTPFGCGMLLSLWLGRRGRLVTLACAPLWSVFFFPVCANLRVILFDGGYPPPQAVNFSLLLAVVSPLLAVCGSLMVYRHRRLRLALAGGVTMPSRIQRLRLPSLSRRFRWSVFALVVALLVGRVVLVLHPLSPRATVQKWLVLNASASIGTWPPTVVGLHELPAQTLAEKQSEERRVAFQVEVSAPPEMAANRAYWLKRALKNPQQRALYGEQALRDSLFRVNRNRQLVQGTARLVRTPFGWQVDAKSFAPHNLHKWVSEVYAGVDR